MEKNKAVETLPKCCSNCSYRSVISLRLGKQEHSLEMLESEIHKLSSTPKTEKKRRKKYVLPLFYSPEELAYSFGKSSAQVWTETLNLVLMCFFMFCTQTFVHRFRV